MFELSPNADSIFYEFSYVLHFYISIEIMLWKHLLSTLISIYLPLKLIIFFSYNLWLPFLSVNLIFVKNKLNDFYLTICLSVFSVNVNNISLFIVKWHQIYYSNNVFVWIRVTSNRVSICCMNFDVFESIFFEQIFRESFRPQSLMWFLSIVSISIKYPFNLDFLWNSFNKFSIYIKIHSFG